MKSIVFLMAFALLSCLFWFSKVETMSALAAFAVVAGYLGCVGLLAYSAAMLTNPDRAKVRFFYGWAMVYNHASGYYEKRVLHFNLLHEPRPWAWWKMFAVKRINGEVHPPSTCHRFWIYTRWGTLQFDVVFDRRKQVYA